MIDTINQRTSSAMVMQLHHCIESILTFRCSCNRSILHQIRDSAIASAFFPARQHSNTTPRFHLHSQNTNFRHCRVFLYNTFIVKNVGRKNIAKLYISSRFLHVSTALQSNSKSAIGA
jgi:hypothetical protein